MTKTFRIIRTSTGGIAGTIALTAFDIQQTEPQAVITFSAPDKPVSISKSAMDYHLEEVK